MALSQNWTKVTNETDLDDYTFSDFGNISWTDLDSIKWDSAGTRGLKINYDKVSRTGLSQSWSKLTQQFSQENYNWGDAEALTWAESENILYGSPSGEKNRNLEQDWENVSR